MDFIGPLLFNKLGLKSAKSVHNHIIEKYNIQQNGRCSKRTVQQYHWKLKTAYVNELIGQKLYPQYIKTIENMFLSPDFYFTRKHQSSKTYKADTCNRLRILSLQLLLDQYYIIDQQNSRQLTLSQLWNCLTKNEKIKITCRNKSQMKMATSATEQ